MRKLLEDNPIIAALTDYQDVEEVIKSDCSIVFLLNGDILTLKDRVEYLKSHEKKVFVHLDRISGLSNDAITIKYLEKEFHIDGIITTRMNLVKEAMNEDIKVVHRVFLLDSMSLKNTCDHLRKMKPHAIEIVPGVVTKVVKKLHKEFPHIPIICGGLIEHKQEIIDALKNGAMAISTSKQDLW